MQLVTVPAMMVLVHVIVGLTLVVCTDGGRDASRLARSVCFDRSVGLCVIAALGAGTAGPASRPPATGLYPRRTGQCGAPVLRRYLGRVRVRHRTRGQQMGSAQWIR